MKRCLNFALCVLLLSSLAQAQSVDDLKKCVAFLFGQVHAAGLNGEFLKDGNGVPVLLETPLGTAFLVWYPDKRGGDGYGFAYLVTAKHVLRDVDDSYLRNLSVRVNLRELENGSDLLNTRLPSQMRMGSYFGLRTRMNLRTTLPLCHCSPTSTNWISS